MLYTNGVHLTATSLAELCEYAISIGLNNEWLQLGSKNIHPHLKICGNVRRRVLADNRVKQVSSKEIVRLTKLNYVLPQTEGEVRQWENYHGKKIEEISKPSEKDYSRMLKNIFEKSGLEMTKSEQRVPCIQTS
jgi:hypothetical protein